VRQSWKDEFAWFPEDVRRHAIDGWLHEAIYPIMGRLHRDRRHVFGEDFARNRNLSSITVLEEDVDLTRRVKLQLELFNCPFSCQEQILFYILDQLPRFRGGAMDAGGNGSALAEKTAQRYGTQLVERVMLNNAFYLAHMPKLKAGLEDGTLADIPRDAQLRDDLRAIQLIDGIPKLPKGDTSQSAAAKAAAAEGGEKLKRHGDFAVSLFLANYAWFREVGAIDWQAAPGRSRHAEGSDGGHGFRMRASTDGDDLVSSEFGMKGGW
jgi:phage FluMu gp28-like protein